jgi:RecB family exonuclease
MHDEFIEVLLINDELEYAGTADRIVTLMDGRLVIFDLKTGSKDFIDIQSDTVFIYRNYTDTLFAISENEILKK